MKSVNFNQTPNLRLYSYMIYETPVPVRVIVQQTETTLSARSAQNAPLRIGTSVTIPLSEALFLQNQHKAIIQLPDFMQIPYLEEAYGQETQVATLSPLYRCFFSASGLLLEEF